MKYSLIKASIHLDAIKKNIQNLKLIINKKSKFMAVVKADAYGHGAVKVAQTALQSGADSLGVARLDEAVTIRQAGIMAPLLVFGYVYTLQADLLYDLDITSTIYNYDMAKALSQTACEKNIKIKAHIKLDTGMGRVGIILDPNNSDSTFRKKAIHEIKKIVTLPGINIEGIYTHLASADSKDRTYTNLQLDMFNLLIDDLKREKINFDLYHASNSAGILGFPDSHFDLVRAGVSIYGLYPSNEMDKSRAKLTPAMTLKSIITSVRKVPKGFKVSYGMTYKTRKSTILASVPIGYADGFSRLFSSNGFLLVNGHRAPIVGRICMDQTIIDVGHIPDVRPEDEVIIIGSQGDETLSAEELAKNIGTINYEIVSSFTSRVKKAYTNS